MLKLLRHARRTFARWFASTSGEDAGTEERLDKGSSFNVLIVDSDPSIAAAFGGQLKLEPHVRPAVTAEEALRLASASAPNMALIHVSDSQFDGFDLAGKLRERYGNTTFIVGLCSGEDNSDLGDFDFHMARPTELARWQALFELPTTLGRLPRANVGFSNAQSNRR